PALVLRKQRRCAEQRRRVAIMSAGMHDTGILRSVVEPGFFGDRQCVHIGAQPDGIVTAAARECRDDAVAADARHERNTEFGESLLHKGGGLLLLERELGIGMKMAAPARQLVMKIGGQWCIPLFLGWQA